MVRTPRPALRSAAVAVDFAIPSLRAAAWAASNLIGVELTLVHVVDIPSPPRFQGRRGPGRQTVLAAARRAAERRLGEFASDAGASGARLVVRVGRTIDELIAAADECRADVIMVGEHGARRGGVRFLGSTADRLLRTSRTPVLLARGTPERVPRSILCAVDESGMTLPVLAWTRALAHRFKAGVIALHAVEPTVSGAAQLGTPVRRTDAVRADLERTALRWLDAQVAPLRAAHVPVATKIVFGEAGVAIVNEAKRANADLVVVGRRGGGRAARWLMGTSSNRVVRQSNRSVLLIPEGR